MDGVDLPGTSSRDEYSNCLWPEGHTRIGLYEKLSNTISRSSLAFRDLELEREYQRYVHDMTSQCLGGMWGTVSIFSLMVLFHTSTTIVIAAVQYITSATPGSSERALFMAPIPVFCVVSLIRLFRRKHHTFDEVECRTWATRALILFTYADALLCHVNDSFPQHLGCEVHRFRCPFSFSSAIFTARFISVDVASTFWMMPSLPFPRMLFVFAVQFLCRLWPLSVYRNFFWTSFWSLSCVLIQASTFLLCRYLRELSDRKLFLLHADVTFQQAQLEQILDNMVPPAFRHNANTETCAVHVFEHVTILFCSFSNAGLENMEPIQAFKRMNEVYKAFDLMLDRSNAYKVEHVGNDYMVMSRIFDISKDLDTVERRQQCCITLAHLANKILTKGRELLLDSGIELQVGIASGPVFAAVIGQTRKYLRVLGDTVNTAARMCSCAKAWNIQCSGWTADTLQKGGVGIVMVGDLMIKGKGIKRVYRLIISDFGPNLCAYKVRKDSRILDTLRDAMLDHEKLVRSAVMTCAGVRLSSHSYKVMKLLSSWSGTFLDQKSEQRYLEYSSMLPDHKLSASVRSCIVIGCQMFFLVGMPMEVTNLGNSSPKTVPEAVHRVKAAILVCNILVAFGPCSLVGHLSQRKRWLVMHSFFFIGCCFLADAFPHSFLLLGLVMAISQCFIACPSVSVSKTRVGVTAMLITFFIIFQGCAGRKAMMKAGPPEIMIVFYLVYIYSCWLRNENIFGRTFWCLMEQRNRGWYSVWSTLADLYPAYVLQDLQKSILTEGHSKQAYVLFADLSNYTEKWNIVQNISISDRDAGYAKGIELVLYLHQLFSAFDCDVAKLPLLYKMDSIGDAYVVASLLDNELAVPSDRLNTPGLNQLLSLACSMQEAIKLVNQNHQEKHPDDTLSLRTQRLRIGIAHGSVVAGVMGSQQQRYQFFGGALTIAERFQRQCLPGETRVQQEVACAATDFEFSDGQPDEPSTSCSRSGPQAGRVLLGRRRRSSILKEADSPSVRQSIKQTRFHPIKDFKHMACISQATKRVHLSHASPR